MANDLLELVLKRGRINSKISRFATELQSNEWSLNELLHRRQKIEELYPSFEEVQSKIELLDKETTAVAHQGETTVFEKAYFSLQDSFSERIRILEQGTINQASSTSDCHEVRLPKVNIPVFSGAHDKWLFFYDTFNSLIHSNKRLSNIQKFHYLRSSLDGDAAKIISTLPTNEANYVAAFDLLVKRYDNKRVIVQRHVQALFDYPRMSVESFRELRSLLDVFQENLRALEILEQPVSSMDILLTHLLFTKLDKITGTKWQTSIAGTKIPTLAQMFSFLSDCCDILEATTSTDYTIVSEDPKSLILPCPKCKDYHPLYKCLKFLTLSPPDRLSEAKRLNVCVNCLRSHQGRCHGACKMCRRPHHTLLHIDYGTSNAAAIHPKFQGFNRGFHATSTHNSKVFLATVIVYIQDASGKLQECRALLDCGSEVNLISNTLCTKLRLKKLPNALQLNGVNEAAISTTYAVETIISSRINSFSNRLHCNVVNKIAMDLPSVPFNTTTLNIPENVVLADPHFNIPSQVDLLIGAEIFYDLFLYGIIRLDNNTCVLRDTVFGWIVTGSIPSQGVAGAICAVTTSVIEKQIRKFWEIEDCHTDTKIMNEEDLQCEDLFQSTTYRGNDGRFIVRLPVKVNAVLLGDSYKNAEKRLMHLERKFKINREFKREYCTFMDDYINLNHMSKITSNEQISRRYYIPHHAVIKQSSLTSKLRVVFDASSKSSNGYSLNDNLLSGPILQQELIAIIMRYRQYKYVMTADIEKMYRQIKIENVDSYLQLILWRDSETDPISHFKLNTVTYGTKSAPYLAVRCLHQLADDINHIYPMAADTIKNAFYIDDLLTGRDTIDELVLLQKQLNFALSSAGFILRKWCTNDSRILNKLDIENSKVNIIDLDKDSTIKTLGLIWNPISDTFQYKTNVPQYKTLTKRIVLSIISKIFDPLGLINPSIVFAKVFMQKMWVANLKWDETLPTELANEWNKYSDTLSYIDKIKIPRHFVACNHINLEIHGFADASASAYGAVAYIKSVTMTGEGSVYLVSAKSKVAPLKTITIAKLELMAALLLSKLIQKIVTFITLPINKVYLWSDSQITLAWIKKPPHHWQMFVANRVNEIQTLTKNYAWRYVNTKNNPADLLSRGVQPSQLENATIWWSGPEWLQYPIKYWPHYELQYDDGIPETAAHCHIVTAPAYDLWSRYSTLNTLVRIVALCKRFIRNCRTIKINRCVNEITDEELNNAIVSILQNIQLESYSQEISDLKKDNTYPQVNSKSKLLCLSPFISSDGLLRVGGRLLNANLPFAHRHQILLPPRHAVTTLLIRHYHIKQLHAGTQGTLAALREKYWIISARSSVRGILRKCVVCFRTKPSYENQIMGNLPSARINVSRPFMHSGVDYGGPFHIKEGGRRSVRKIKCYICLFVCFTTKAVHLEIVTDLTSEAFLAALRRFTSRRGTCMHLYSDNATTFIGANTQLLEMSGYGPGELTWHHIPPRSPHFGGLWEAAIKSAKHHITRIAGDANLTYEEFLTLLIQIEGILNSRPISPLSNDPNDLAPLTPNHFLIGDSLTAPADSDLLAVQMNRLSRWQRVQQLQQHYWKRWCTDYVSSLQPKSKWASSSKGAATSYAVGRMIILRDDNAPPFKWPLGRISAVHPGNDGAVRVVSIKTKNGEVKRAINKICVLPID